MTDREQQLVEKLAERALDECDPEYCGEFSYWRDVVKCELLPHIRAYAEEVAAAERERAYVEAERHANVWDDWKTPDGNLYANAAKMIADNIRRLSPSHASVLARIRAEGALAEAQEWDLQHGLCRPNEFDKWANGRIAALQREAK